MMYFYPLILFLANNADSTCCILSGLWWFLSTTVYLCKRFELRSGPTGRRSWSGFKPFNTLIVVRKKIRKRRLFRKVQAFCEEKVLRYLLGVFSYAVSETQCWQAEKWCIHYLICTFQRWLPKWRNINENMLSNVLRMPNWYKSIQKHLRMTGCLHWHQFMQIE